MPPKRRTAAVREPGAKYLAPAATLVDSNVLIDVLEDDPAWAEWSFAQLDALGQQAPLVINPIVLAEISVHYELAADLEAALAMVPLKRETLPWDAAFLAGQAFRAYRRRKGARISPLPDFYIGAHAFLSGMRLLTRDASRFSTYFPNLVIVSP